MVVRSLRWAAVGSLAFSGCIIVDDFSRTDGIMDGPFNETGELDGDDVADDLPTPNDDQVLDETGDADDVPLPDTGGDPNCGPDVLVDGGFEQGTPHATWIETSPLFGTPICDDACSDDPDAAPYSGDWFAWFGGAQQADAASLSQTFSVEGDSAQLSLRFAINAASGTGDDVFAVLVDGNTVFMRTDADIADFDDYTLIPITLDQWADGQAHELRIESEVFGNGLTNFFVDDVRIVGCGEPGSVDTGETGIGTTGSGTTGSGSDSGTTGSGSDSGTTGSGSGSDSGTTGSGSDSGSVGSGSVGSGSVGSGSVGSGTVGSGSGTTDSGTTGSAMGSGSGSGSAMGSGSASGSGTAGSTGSGSAGSGSGTGTGGSGTTAG